MRDHEQFKSADFEIGDSTLGHIGSTIGQVARGNIADYGKDLWEGAKSLFSTSKDLSVPARDLDKVQYLRRTDGSLKPMTARDSLETHQNLRNYAKMIPFVGAAPSGTDAYGDFREGNVGSGILNTISAGLSVIPGANAAKGGVGATAGGVRSALGRSLSFLNSPVAGWKAMTPRWTPSFTRAINSLSLVPRGISNAGTTLLSGPGSFLTRLGSSTNQLGDALRLIPRGMGYAAGTLTRGAASTALSPLKGLFPKSTDWAINTAGKLPWAVPWAASTGSVAGGSALQHLTGGKWGGGLVNFGDSLNDSPVNTAFADNIFGWLRPGNQWSGGASRTTPTHYELHNVASAQARAAIQEAQARGIPLPENAYDLAYSAVKQHLIQNVPTDASHFYE